MKIDEAKALIILATSQSLEEKARVCDHLAIVGSPKAVPALVGYLPDPQMAVRARTALQNIPDVAAGDALTKALRQVKGDFLIGVITSLGARKETDAVPQLCVLVDGADQAVVMAAISALGQIANGEAIAKLRVVMAKGSEDQRTAAAHAALVAAGSLPAEARKTLLTSVSAAKVPEHIQVTAGRL